MVRVAALAILFYLAMALAHGQFDYKVVANYNTKAENMVSKLNECNDAYEGLAMAANLFGKSVRRTTKVLDISKPAPPLTQLKDQVEAQIKVFERCTKELNDAAKDFKKALTYVNTEEMLEGTYDWGN